MFQKFYKHQLTYVILIVCFIQMGSFALAQETCPALVSQIISQVETYCSAGTCAGNAAYFSVPAGNVSNPTITAGTQYSMATLSEIDTSTNDGSSSINAAFLSSPASSTAAKFWLIGNARLSWEQTGAAADTSNAAMLGLVKQDTSLYADTNAQAALTGNASAGAMPVLKQVSGDGQWTQIELNNQTGWVATSLLIINPPDWNRLLAANGGQTAFYLTANGSSLDGCSPAFLVMKANASDATINLNGAEIRFSTALLHVDMNNQLEMVVIDGTANIGTSFISSGMASAAPLAQDSRLAGTWSQPRVVSQSETDVVNALRGVMAGASTGVNGGAACGLRPEWPTYTVQENETLESIAIAKNTTVDILQSANCLLYPVVGAGQQLYVPPPPTATPCFGCGQNPGANIVQPPNNLGTQDGQNDANSETGVTVPPTIAPPPTQPPQPTAVPPDCPIGDPSCDGGNVEG